MAQNDPAFLELNQGPLGRAERLRQSADEAARLARTLFITFLVVGLYIAITIAGTTDIQLLKVSPVQLPLLDIGLPIVGFYAVVPWLFVLIHLNLLLQLYLLGRKLHAFNEAVQPLDPADRQEQRERLFPFPLSHMLSGHQHSPLVKVLLAAMVWTTVVILPLVLLIWAEVRFLPYRDHTVTWVQRAAVGVDLVGLWLFWPLIVTGDHLSRWWRGFFRSLAYHPLLGLWARLRAGLRWIRPRAKLRRGTLERWQRVYSPSGQARAGRGLAVTTLAALGVYGLVMTGVGAESMFRRSLDLQEAILVRGDPPAEVMAALLEGNDEERVRALKRVIGLSLADRDLRGANLYRAVLPKADLRFAGLEGADLRAARLEGANLIGARLEGANLHSVRLEGADLRDAQLQGANLIGARLKGANFRRARLEGARLSSVRLEGADLRDAQLQGAELNGALLEGADLSFVPLEGANLNFAGLESADLQGARLEGASLIFARLEGADLRDAQLQGANLIGARLKGGDLKNAFLQGVRTGCFRLRCTDLTQADLRGVKLSRADLREANLDGANLEGACGTDVRLPQGYSVPPCDEVEEAPSSSPPPPEASPYAPRITVQQD